MGMTVVRWAIGVVLGSAAFAALMVPFPPTTPRGWDSAAPAPLVVEVARLTKTAGRARAAVSRYRAQQALDRWRLSPHRDTTLVRIDPSVPPSIAGIAEAAAREQWASLGATASSSNAEVFIYLDSTFIPRAGDATGSHVLESRTLVDVSFALPAATDGQRCVSLVRLRGSTPTHVNALRERALLGPCGFYAAFGAPGTAVSTWLTATSFRFAGRSDWSVARAPAIDASSIYSLSEPAVRCLTGESNACATALGSTTIASAAQPSTDGGGLIIGDALTARSVEARSLGDAEDQLLADAVRSLGPERFGRFWKSAPAIDDGFLAAAGSTFGSWTQRWLARTYSAAPTRPTATARDLFWFLAFVPLAVMVAARRRERAMR